jgi:hypothetical protein
VTRNGPRDAAAVLAARYWLTAKGWAAVAAMEAEAPDPDDPDEGAA